MNSWSFVVLVKKFKSPSVQANTDLPSQNVVCLWYWFKCAVLVCNIIFRFAWLSEHSQTCLENDVWWVYTKSHKVSPSCGKMDAQVACVHSSTYACRNGSPHRQEFTVYVLVWRTELWFCASVYLLQKLLFHSFYLDNWFKSCLWSFFVAFWNLHWTIKKVKFNMC